MKEQYIKAKAGAGLPSLEKNVIKYLVVWLVRILFNWKIASYLLQREIRIIENLLKDVKEEDLTKQAYIQRAFAIEEHSRNYSISMTLKHLSITAKALMGVIHSLSNEKPFERPITIEGVKPQGNSMNASKEFFKTMRVYEKFIAKLPKKHSKMTKKHPWFVEFNNADWHCFMFMHTLIHRRQLQSIIERLDHE